MKKCLTAFLSLFLAELSIPFWEYYRDDRSSVVEHVVVERDRLALVCLAVEGRKHLVEQLPASLAGEDQMAVLKSAA